jgi:hypothetical protein
MRSVNLLSRTPWGISICLAIKDMAIVISLSLRLRKHRLGDWREWFEWHRDQAGASAVSRFLGFLLNSWHCRKSRVFKMLASSKRPFQREVEVTNCFVLSVITCRNDVIPKSYWTQRKK